MVKGNGKMLDWLLQKICRIIESHFIGQRIHHHRCLKWHICNNYVDGI